MKNQKLINYYNSYAHIKILFIPKQYKIYNNNKK